MINRFQFHPMATLVMMICIAILVSLGTWQLERRAWKLGLIEAVETRAGGTSQPLSSVLAKARNNEDQRYARIAVRGIYQHQDEVHVFGTLGPKPGYFIFTPFVPADSENITESFFINRGFVPQDNKRSATRLDGQIDGEVTVTGLYRQSEVKPWFANMLSPANDTAKNIWYTRNPAKFGTAGIAKHWYIDSLGTESTAPLPQGGTTRISFNNRHLEYALTWYGLAITLIGVWLAFSWRRKD